VKDNERRQVTKQRMEIIKKERDYEREMSPMSKQSNNFGSSAKFINSRDITMD